MLLIFGLGYTGTAIATAALARGQVVAGTTRGEGQGGTAPLDPLARDSSPGPHDWSCASGGQRPLAWLPFDAAAAVAAATHVLVTVPPDAAGEPVLARYGAEIGAAARAGGLRWIGYLSSTVVYGDCGGGWVDEATEPAPSSPRGQRRLAAEAAWRAAAGCVPLDIFRLAGIYGPGRSAFEDLRAGRARRVGKPGHAFGRIHRDDIVRAVLAAMDRPGTNVRVLNLADDLPAESAETVAYAAAQLGLPPPPLVPFETAVAAMSPTARGFWAENRKVSSRATQAALGIRWRYPTYREGLEAVLAEERRQHLAKQGEVGGA